MESAILAPSSRQDQALAEVLHDLRTTDSSYCRTELTEPWGLDLSACDVMTFHFVARGRAWLTTDAGAGRWLDVGDLVVFPHGQGHCLRSAPDAQAWSVVELPKQDIGRRSQTLVHGGGGRETLLICGGAQFDPPDHPLVELLPEMLLVCADSGQSEEYVTAATTALGIEAARPRPGGETLITRLSEVLVIHAVRTWLETSPDAEAGWLGALRDSHLGHVLQLVHQHPERRWTVASMAAAAHMSRSLFAQRFTDQVGVAPMAYLTVRRMQLATSLMRDAGLAPAQVALRVGYDSIAAFSRAYKRTVGQPPGAIRRDSRPGLAGPTGASRTADHGRA